MSWCVERKVYSPRTHRQRHTVHGASPCRKKRLTQRRQTNTRWINIDDDDAFCGRSQIRCTECAPSLAFSVFLLLLNINEDVYAPQDEEVTFKRPYIFRIRHAPKSESCRFYVFTSLASTHRLFCGRHAHVRFVLVQLITNATHIHTHLPLSDDTRIRSTK